jgi:peptide/nickel transport system ATP-binding protein
MSPDALHLRDLTVRVGDRTLLDAAALSLPAGQVVGLMGPSGAGKSLLLRSMVGAVRARPGVVAGSVEVPGRPATDLAGATDPPLHGAVAWMPQGGGLDPTWRVGRQLRRLGADPSRALAGVGLDHPAAVARQWPHQLSGGMRRRVGLAVALATGARFLLVDEPTTGLDPIAARGVLRLLQDQARAGRGVLMVSHDAPLLGAFADAVWALEGGRVCPPGRA